MTYNEKHMKTKSSVTALGVLFQDEVRGDYHNLFFSAAFPFSSELPFIEINDKLKNSSFTIEALPADSEEKCGKIDLKDLELVSCEGRIKIRPN